MRSICVFCGSNAGNAPIYAETARRAGQIFASAGLTVVYGGGSVGLMGVLADAALAAGGRVIGVIPRTLWEREVGHRGLSDLRIVDTMHERKALMSELSDGFLALPGGIGTLDELFEIWTWAQLGVHRKPCGLLNVNGYFDALLTFLNRTIAAGFLRAEYFAMLQIDDDPSRMLTRFAEYQPPPVPQWLNPQQT